MKYSEIKTPEQLLKYMNENIKYGFVDDIGKKHGSWDNEEFQFSCKTKWKLSSPERLIKVQYGHCWDQVELEREWFTNNGYQVKTFYIWFELPYNNSYSTHTYLVFESGKKYYYFEHADFNNRGIYEFETYEDAINYQRKKFIEFNQQRNIVCEDELKHLHIYEYSKPIYDCTMNEFINHILANSKEVDFEKNKKK